MVPFRALLTQDAVFQWLPEHDHAFVEAKSRLSTTPVLTYFGVDRQTVLATDASRLKGLGFVLLQLVDDVWRPVQAGSRFLTPTQSRYAMIELEALAACCAMKKCNMYLQGLHHFTLLTDHQLLIPILNSMGVADVENSRLQRLMMKMLPYSFTVQWVKGKDHTPSRFPVDQPSLDDELCEAHAEAAVHAHFADKSTEDLQLHEVSNAQHTDPQLSRVADYVRCGWPDSLEEVDDLAKPFWPTRHQLYLANPLPCNSLLLMNCRTVITLHEGHQGIDKTRCCACDSVFWSGIDREIEDMIKRCHQCLSLLPANCKEPLLQPPLPTRPWDKLGLDLCTLNGTEYLIITDYFSFFTEVRDLRKNTKAPIVIKELKEVFSRFGSPVEVVSDGGPSSVVRPSKTLPKNGVSNTPSRLLHMPSETVRLRQP